MVKVNIYCNFLTLIQPGWGFWDFVQIETSEYDVKQNVSQEIFEILQKYENLINKNNFIYNDPAKPPKQFEDPKNL